MGNEAQITRRALLILFGSGVTATMLPTFAAETLPASTFAPAAVGPAWGVGHGDNWDWKAITAPSADEAKRIWTSSWCGMDRCEGESLPECACEFCSTCRGLDVERKPTWDGRTENLSRADWLEADMGANCSRCDNETDAWGGGHAVGDEAVCERCMTLADWRVIDPEYAAELEADLAEESEYEAGRLALAQAQRAAQDGGRDV